MLQPLEQTTVENLQSYLFSRAIAVSRVCCGLIAIRHQLLKKQKKQKAKGVEYFERAF
ncbi:MAG: hypothetical protein H3C25_03275 [Candidatus Brocadia sapporoensis]|nr:hypothetical protein [Candidatus Brocadia sapporoensis]